MKPVAQRHMVLWESGIGGRDLVLKVSEHCPRKAAIKWQAKEN